MKTVTVCIVAALAFLSSPNSFGQQSSGLVYIEGTVTRADQSPLPGATISLSNGSTSTTNRSGHYFAVLPAGFSGSITASLSGYTLSPFVRSYSNISTDQLHQDFAGGTYTVSGHIFAGGASASVYFDGAGQGVTTATGDFSVVIPQGYSGDAIPLNTALSFIPSSSPFPGNLVSNRRILRTFAWRSAPRRDRTATTPQPQTFSRPRLRNICIPWRDRNARRYVLFLVV